MLHISCALSGVCLHQIELIVEMKGTTAYALAAASCLRLKSTSYAIMSARFTMHKMDALNPDGWLYIQSKHVQAAVSFAVNGVEQDPLLTLPDPLNATSGAIYYSRTMVPNRFYSWSGSSYNDTTATILVAGVS